MDITALTGIIGTLLYVALALIALWGAFCVVVVWRRVSQARFSSEAAQEEFLDDVEAELSRADFDAVEARVEEDPRALAQLILIAVANRSAGVTKLRHHVADRFRRDVLADIEFRLSWVQTVIKSAPMVGLLGTVVGMMGAFGKLAGGDKVEASHLADDIAVALTTTACGLAIAIPLVLCTASINVRIRQMEDLVAVGLTQFFDALKMVAGAPQESPAPSELAEQRS